MTQFFRGTPDKLQSVRLEAAAEIDLQLYGQLCSCRDVPSALRAIPGEILPSESQTLFYLLSEEWSGKGSVLEVGTLFGASTQAIALGIAANPKSAATRHFAADAFLPYHDPAEFRRQLAPLLSDHPEWEAILSDYETDGFEHAFRALHANQPYSSSLEIRRVLVPLAPGDSDEDLRALMRECGTCGVAFIDSAKDWYPVLRLAASLVDHLEAGSLVAWQDYRWFNSYAIPVFASLFAAHFKQLAIVGNTHVFEYLGGLSERKVRREMPETPMELGLETVGSIFQAEARGAYLRNDAYGVLSAGLQLAFASAACGELERAQDQLSALQVVPGFDAHQALFAIAEGELNNLKN
jgi:hypothetical protein